MAFYNIDKTAHGNSDVSIIITECTAAGVSTPAENYSFAHLNWMNFTMYKLKHLL